MERKLVYFRVSDSTIKNLLFELKKVRNDWAHQAQFTFREVYRYFPAYFWLVNGYDENRVCDTVQLFLEKLGVDQNTEFFKKVNYLREQVLLKLTQEIIETNKKQTGIPLVNLSTQTPTMMSGTQVPVISDFQDTSMNKPKGPSVGGGVGGTKEIPTINSQKTEFTPVPSRVTEKKKFVNNFPEMVDD